MDISSVTSQSLWDTYSITNQKAATVQQNFEQALENAKTQQASGNTLTAEEDKELLDACKEMETYFISSIFKQMKKSVESEDSLIPKGDYEKIFEDYLTDEQSKEMTEAGGIGLAKMLYEQMKKC
jgi:flagellar protein FlgJ